MKNSSAGGIVLFSSAFLAIIISNSPFKNEFHHFWEHEFSIGFNGSYITKSLHHWINDGLMAVFFFVIGLELKREIIAGELSRLKNTILPLSAAVGGMLLPAMIYLAFNTSGSTSKGWGIPMATDIAFALGILYLLGDKVPISLKIFITALAIADDIGAVLVIAFFYTSDINFINLTTGAGFLILLIIANKIGVRNTLFYAIVGIGGLWLAFLMSGVHATIAAVLAAFTIPARTKISENVFSNDINYWLTRYKKAQPDQNPTVTVEQLHIIEEIRNVSKNALTPLQRLEHAMHPFVVYFVMPVFAISNAGISFSEGMISEIGSPICLGVFFGLLAGKVIGIVGSVSILTRLKLATLPADLNKQHILAAGFLSAIGFTMSLFVAGLAFTEEKAIIQAKLGILIASFIAGIIGFLIIKKTINKKN